MKNKKNTFDIPQETIDDLLRQFDEKEREFARLSSPLVNVGVASHQDGLFEN